MADEAINNVPIADRLRAFAGDAGSHDFNTELSSLLAYLHGRVGSEVITEALDYVDEVRESGIAATVERRARASERASEGRYGPRGTSRRGVRYGTVDGVRALTAEEETDRATWPEDER